MYSKIELQKELREVTIKLREAYYVNHCEEPKMPAYAFGGKPTESIGPFVEYNLRGGHCKRSRVGLCTPCFYSKFPEIIGITDYTEYLIEQIDKLIDNWNITVLKRQNGKIYYEHNKLKYKNNKPVALCITPVGSFFDNSEFSTVARRHLLNRLVEKSDESLSDIILYVETHVIDFINWCKNKTLEELELLQRLHLRIVFGFESSNDFIRNVLYEKNIVLKEFETAVSYANGYGFKPYAFVFAGLYPMTHGEIITDVTETFLYLKKMGVVPVLMFANTQEYTINDLLVKYKYADFINPITVLEVIKIMLEIFGRENSKGYDAWLIADPVGGPPTPVKHIFSDSSVKCCADKIYKLIKVLRKEHTYSMFIEEYNSIMKCTEHQEILDKLLTIPQNTLIERTRNMVSFVNDKLEDYIKDLRRDELIRIKATLLCEGINADASAVEAMKSLGITDGFIHSSNLLLDSVPVNACMMEKFVEEPHCFLTYFNEEFYLYYRENDSKIADLVGKVDFINLPEWSKVYVEKYVVGDYLRPHSINCISIWPNQICALEQQRCQFCSLTGEEVLKPNIVADMVDIALQYNPLYEVHLGGGIYNGIEENEDYYSCIASLIHKKYPMTKISLETIPPQSKGGMEKYKESGISSIIMNLEIANEELRRRICPGKSHISLEQYIEAYKEGVRIFGKWNVASVLLWGFEEVSEKQFIECVNMLCSLGVYPVIMPFQPLKDCALVNVKSTDIDTYMKISMEVGAIISKACENESICKFGCINCGACSIENSLLKEKNYEYFNY